MRNDGPELSSLAARFEGARPMLRAVAYRMLGPGGEADDVVQEAWLRLVRADTSAVDNLEGWLTTTVARLALDALRVRSRAERREEPFDARGHEAAAAAVAGRDLEYDTQVADAVGLALLVVLDRLDPAERVAFVLHDAFDLPFDEIAAIVGRSPAAARQLASRARRRVRATPLRQAAALRGSSLQEQRDVVEAYIAAARAGDLAGLVAVLDPDVVLHPDPADVARGAPAEARGARQVAGMALAFAQRAPYARAALVDGAVGVIVAPRGRLLSALRLTIRGGRIATVDVVTDPARLAELPLAVLDA